MSTPTRPSRIGPRLRTVLRRVGATSSAVIVLAGVGAVALAGTVDEATLGAEVPPLEVDVPPAELALVCPGPPRLATADLGGDLTYDPEFDTSPAETSSATTGMTVRRDDDGGPAEGTLGALDASGEALTTGPDAALATLPDPAAATVLRADPVDDRAAFATGTALARTDAGDLRGIAAAPCRAASSTVWLVGGTTALGSSTRLVLTNPGSTPATVTVSAWGATGPLDMDRAAALLVPPGGESALLLEALATGEDRLALRIDAAGGRVSASLQESQLRGLVAAGVDLVSAGSDPATSVLVPGITLPETEADDPEPSVLRILNPGAEQAHVTLTLLGEEGEVAVPGVADQVLEPGTVTDVSLAGLPPGRYTAALTSDVPVTAGASLVLVGEAGDDDPDQPLIERAWVPAVTAGPSGAVALPGYGSLVEVASLVVGNPADQPVDVTLTPIGPDGTAGDDVVLPVPERSSARFDVAELGDDVAGVVLHAPSDVVGAVIVSADPGGGAAFSVVPVSGDPDTDQSVSVRLGPG